MTTDGLVGREEPLGTLARAITRVPDHGDAVLLCGEPGIGKSACLRAAEEMARDAGHRVLDTVGSEAESALPFAGLHRLLRPLLGTVDALPGVQRRELLTALGSRAGPPPDLLVVSLAVLGLIGLAGGRGPLLITVDDLQWIDDASLHVLTFLARRLDRRPVLVLAAASWARPAPAVAGAFRELRLERLDEAAAHEVLRRRAPDLDEAHQRWALQEAAGNPLALVELAAVARSVAIPRTDPFGMVVPLTPALRRAFAGRLPDLPAASRDAVLVAALSAGDSVQEILAATAVLSGTPTTTAVLEAPQAMGLLHFDEAAVRFLHPLVRSAVALSESVSRRQAAHTALGAAVTTSSYRRTWHRAHGAAGCDDAIAAELELNGSAGSGRGDPAGAVMALRRAAQLSTAPADRGRRLLLAARHAAGMGQFAVVDHLVMAALGDELSEFDRMRAELLRDDRDEGRLGGGDRVIRLSTLAGRASAAGQDGLALELAYEAGLRSFSTQVGPRAVAAVAGLVDTVARDRSDPRAVAVLALADPVGHGREVLSALADVRAEDIDDPDALRALAVAACSVGDYARGSELLDRAEVVLRCRGLHGALARVLCLAADVRLDHGDWDRAAAALAELESLTAGSAPTVQRAEVLATAAKAAALRGDTTTALALVVEAEHCPAVRGGSSDLARAQIARGIAYLSAGRHLDAYLALSRVFDPGDPSHHRREQCSALAYLAEAAVRCGHHDGAREVVQRMELMAATSGWPLLLGQLHYARALLAGDDDAERLFLAGLAADPTGWPWPRARTQLAFGRWLRRRRQVSRSRGPLREAQLALRQLGATRWAQEALDELEATGRRSDARSGSSSVASLSAQELKIARLAARGLSNGEIGQQLGLSPRTVGSHLYRIFPKLGVSTRGQIASRLAGHEVASTARS